jgi:hypothetical protein
LLQGVKMNLQALNDCFVVFNSTMCRILIYTL